MKAHHDETVRKLIRHHERQQEYWQDMVDSLGGPQTSEQWYLFDKYSGYKESHEERIEELKAKLNK